MRELRGFLDPTDYTLSMKYAKCNQAMCGTPLTPVNGVRGAGCSTVPRPDPRPQETSMTGESHLSAIDHAGTPCWFIDLPGKYGEA